MDVLHCGWAGWGQDVMAYGNYDVPTFTWDGSIHAVSVFKDNPKKYANWFQLNGIERDSGAEAVKAVGDEKKYTAINQYIAGKKFKTLEGRDVWFDKDHKIPISIWPANWVQIQDGKMATLFFSSADSKNQVPYKEFKFQAPPWVK